LTGEVDIEALIATIPDSYTIRGLFFTQLVADLGDAFAPLTSKLCSPPDSGRYLAFTSYPIRDHVRLIDAAARRLYPGCPSREAHRLRARAELDTFAQSMVGKSIVSVIRDPATLLLRYSEIFGPFVKGPSAKTSREGQEAVKLELVDFFGSIGYQIGVFEGFVMNFGLTPRIEVHRLSPDKFSFLVEWH
jgi:uncharacterized protein (TIGR02265 family)